ncbi:M48 family peptidase [Brevundimonas diminuta]|uniref:M48 family metallopeptidase n=1 Tax=Brevundimonas diminuta TaxID=293 RepID=UPI00168BCEA3|nr:SprT family zinc-dependent metalloprotease [Brevundimonas diminuta]MBD3572816.1 M48 family peptidase [Brevundimonas diminuta]
MRLTLHYGSRSANYEVRENVRLTARLRIHVEPTGTLVVEAPVGTPETDIRAGVQKRARWIMAHIERFEDFRRHALPRDYCSGETHFYLGRRYKLKVLVEPGSRRSVHLVAGRLEVTAASEGADDVRLLLQRWYRQRALSYFNVRTARLAASLPWVSAPPPVKLLKMKRYWGSCSPCGSITLNPALIKAPIHCVEYVLLHELCHLSEHNHSPRFYGLLDRHMPDWREAKEELDGLSEMLLVA